MSREPFNDLSGKRFGKLTAIKIAGMTQNRKTMWLCKCDCGNLCKVIRGHLLNGHTKSCGCIKTEKAKVMFTKHGKCNSKLYHVWASMKQRCCDSGCKSYKNYGGRGIKLCKEWLDFQTFYDWAMLTGYRNGLTIDRIDNNGNYEPSNCRWVTVKVQNENKRSNIFITYKNQTKTLNEWSEDIGIPYKTLWNRVQTLRWNVYEALEKPSRGRGQRRLSKVK